MARLAIPEGILGHVERTLPQRPHLLIGLFQGLLEILQRTLRHRVDLPPLLCDDEFHAGMLGAHEGFIGEPIPMLEKLNAQHPFEAPERRAAFP